jgi:hypothetical protein
MQSDQIEWPDADGSGVSVGDWIEVWCTWTKQPKFDGRPVQISDVVTGGGQTVFRLMDSESGSANNYLPAGSRGFRKVSLPRTSGIRAKSDLLPDSQASGGSGRR